MEFNEYGVRVTPKEARAIKAMVVNEHKLEDASTPLKSAVAENATEDSAGSGASSSTMIGHPRTRIVECTNRTYSWQNLKTIAEEEYNAATVVVSCRKETRTPPTSEFPVLGPDRVSRTIGRWWTINGRWWWNNGDYWQKGNVRKWTHDGGWSTVYKQ